MNNFDTSSTGDNIELYVSYNYDLAQIYYQDFENENTRISFAKNSSIFLLGDTSKPYYTTNELNKMAKYELIQLDELYQPLCPSDYTDYKKSDLIDELKNVTIKQYYETIAKEYSWSAIKDSITHNYYISRGYNQGDAIYIISIDDKLTASYRKSIDHILWDSPIYAGLEVNGQEFYENDLLDDTYEYDKNQVIEKVKLLAISQSAKDWIIENLPNEPKG